MIFTQDEFFIKEALKLAKKGLGWTNPNPMVGAVLVKNGQVIGKSYHKKVGLAHAEIEALRVCKVNPQGATLYINLEPCSHFGRTPPCTDAIIKAKVASVVCSTLDPNSKVSGKGIAKLRKMGINVSVGMLGNEARLLNEAFFTFHTKKRPFIALKFASSLDGKIATKTGDSKWITNERARLFARGLRGEYQAVLVGINTILKDNPHLGTRISGKKDPLRIVIDPKLKIPLQSQVLRDSNVLIITTSKTPAKKRKDLEKKDIKILSLSDNYIKVAVLLSELRKINIISVLVEGGSKTLGAFVDERLFDKLYAFYSPIIIGGEKALSPIGGSGSKFIKDVIKLKDVEFKNFDDNLLITSYNGDI